VIALWLDHEGIETTQMYIHADIKLKEEAMAKTQTVTAPGRRANGPSRLAIARRKYGG
jgi:hypothetical protein